MLKTTITQSCWVLKQDYSTSVRAARTDSWQGLECCVDEQSGGTASLSLTTTIANLLTALISVGFVGQGTNMSNSVYAAVSEIFEDVLHVQRFLELSGYELTKREAQNFSHVTLACLFLLKQSDTPRPFMGFILDLRPFASGFRCFIRI